MRVRLAGLLLALVTALGADAPAHAQGPQTRAERAVYRDYRTDGLISACRHEAQTLRDVLEGIPTQTEIDSPDFRPQLEAAIQEHEAGSCEAEAPATAEPTPEPSGGGDQPSGGGGEEPAAGGGADEPTQSPNVGPDSNAGTGDTGGDAGAGSGDAGAAAGGGAGSGDSGVAGTNTSPPTAADVEPLPAETPVPAATPTPGPLPAEAAGAAATPAVVYRNADDGVPLSLVALAALFAMLAVLALAYLVISRFGWADRRLARPRRAWREAAFRAGGAWGDFTDWLRLGR